MTDVPRHYASSAELCEAVLDQGGPAVALSFSCGKDAVAAFLQLRARGFTRIVPFHMYLLPDLEFVERGIRYYEDKFATPILRVPHPSLCRMMRNLVFQPPECAAIVERVAWPRLTAGDIARHVRRVSNLPEDAWVAIGTRAADSPLRLMSIKRHGSLNPKRRTFLPVYDWKVADVAQAINDAGLKLTVDYRWMGRSFDGIDERFLAPIKKHAPRDYDRILAAFPLAHLEHFRRTLTDGQQ
jgi:3'-phosphoadenosine 5'-phosphosulfate sulfotransferase (PAPS reductase)/FAD synthetase